MTQVSIDNPPVSITLNENESFTVPTGQVLRVTVSSNPEGENVRVNGTNVDDSLDGETVFVGGDTISVTQQASGTGGVHIGGFDVS
jgi:hypothetical protein